MKQNVLFSFLGAKMLIRLQSLKCPCGKPFEDNDNCALCCFCVSATCSDKCHRFYCQDTGLVYFFCFFVFLFFCLDLETQTKENAQNRKRKRQYKINQFENNKKKKPKTNKEN
jgi:hypothetical protein